MTDNLALLQTLRQMSQVILGLLVITGRVTMLGLSRWTDKSGSYRTSQRFYHTELPWAVDPSMIEAARPAFSSPAAPWRT